MLSLEEAERIIKRYGINLALKRDLSLFASSAVALGYGKYLKKIMGFGYNAFGAIYLNGDYYSLTNVDYVASETEKIIKKNRSNLKIFFSKADKIFENVENKLKNLDNKKQMECLKAFIEIYPLYLSSIGVYNCFFRYVMINEGKGEITEEEIKQIGERRNKIAELYPVVEELLKKIAKQIGEKEGFDGDLIRYQTVEEMKKYIRERKLTEEKLSELSQRRKGYLHLYVLESDKEYIITDKNVIEKIYKDFFESKTQETGTLKGSSAYPGFAKGKVFNLDKDKPPQGEYVLVASHTNPNQMSTIKKSLAIVTDEGGILSHAAIIARELKIPCVIGIKIATKIFKTGDMIEVNADKGEVRKI